MVKSAWVVLFGGWVVAVGALACGDDAGTIQATDIDEESPIDEEPEPTPAPEPAPAPEPMLEDPVSFEWSGPQNIGAMYSAHTTTLAACVPDADVCPSGMRCASFTGPVDGVEVQGHACAPEVAGVTLDMALGLPDEGDGEYDVALEITMDQQPITGEKAEILRVSVFKNTLTVAALVEGSSKPELSLDSGVYSVLIEVQNSDSVYLGWRRRGTLRVTGSGSAIVDVPSRPVLMRIPHIEVDGEPAPRAVLTLYGQDGALHRLEHGSPGRVVPGTYRAEVELGTNQTTIGYPVGPHRVADVVVDASAEGTLDIELDFHRISGTLSLARGTSSWDEDGVRVSIIDRTKQSGSGTLVSSAGGEFTLIALPGVYDLSVRAFNMGRAWQLTDLEVDGDMEGLEIDVEIVTVSGELTINGAPFMGGFRPNLTIGGKSVEWVDDDASFSTEVFTGVVNVNTNNWDHFPLEISGPKDDLIFDFSFGSVELDNRTEASSPEVQRAQQVLVNGSGGPPNGWRRMKNGAYHIGFLQRPVAGGVPGDIPLGHTNLGEVVVEGDRTIVLDPAPGLVLRGQLAAGGRHIDDLYIEAVQSLRVYPSPPTAYFVWEVPLAADGTFEVALGEGLWQLRVACKTLECHETLGLSNALTDWFQVPASNTSNFTRH